MRTEILDEALRGGEPARLLEERCRKELIKADESVREAVEAAPKFITDTREKHDAQMEEASSLETQLVMLGDSLDDVAKNSAEMLERSKHEAAKGKALEELSDAIVPFVHVANALKRSTQIPGLTFPQLETTLSTLEAAHLTAEKSGSPQLERTLSELEERADQVKATMKTRFMDLFEVGPQSLSAKLKLSDSSRVQPEAISTALSNVDLLKDAIDSIVSELVRNDVATAISRATQCIESEGDVSYTMDWAEGEDASAELLEFDFDDIEVSTDPEIDAMSDNLDIANAAARALKIYDLLRLKLVGESYSRELAFALQSWFCNHVLPSSVVLSGRRSTNVSNDVPSDTLHSRVAAVSACAKVIQAAIRTRGVNSFVLIVEMDSLESKVGSECRAQAMLKTRRAIASFANASHNNDEIVACPIAADRYVPQEQRPPEYFPPCLVTSTAVQVHQTFMTTRQDALKATQGGSPGIAAAMNAAALECLRAYREDVPVQYGDELRSSLRLKALYYTDCTMFAQSCRLSVKEGTPEAREMMEEVDSLQSAAQKAMAVVRRTAERRLEENLKAACRNGALGAYGTLTRIQRNSALSAAYHAMREVVSVFAQIVPTELAEIAACRLLEKYLSKLCSEVAALTEIAADGCDQIDSILQDASQNVASLMKLVEGMEVVRAGAAPPPAVDQMRTCLRRLHAIREILSSRMEDIMTAHRSGKYEGLISRDEVEHFIKAIFEDTELRSSFIADLDVSLEQENGQWDNANW